MTKKILVIDDSQTDNEVLSQIVRSKGWVALSAFDGESGVKMAKESKPDLIIMDVVMPGINGFQACKMLTRSAETNSIPIIICSNKHQDTDKAWGEKNGAKFYFVKPAKPEELVLKIEELTK